jgi:hypothetical protein
MVLHIKMTMIGPTLTSASVETGLDSRINIQMILVFQFIFASISFYLCEPGVFCQTDSSENDFFSEVLCILPTFLPFYALTWQKRMGEANFEPGLPRQCGKTTTDQ